MLFYTDLDFLFTSTKPLPLFDFNKSIIMARGCLPEDSSELMVGNIMMRCDKRLHALPGMWLAAAMVSTKHEFNDEQKGFNVIAHLFADEIQILPFMKYDKCTNMPDSLVGIHFPGGGKPARLRLYLESSKSGINF